MEQLSNINKQAIDRYFHALSKLGYVSQNQVDGLIVLSYIDDFFDLFPLEINQKDYNTIVKVLECLAGNSCMIDFPTYEDYTDIIHKTITPFKARGTEENDLRVTDTSEFRAE